jgi:acetoin utilization deacetylase AcuC-like enzyme
MFISLHRYDDGLFYPGGEPGHFSKIGEGKGKGYNINIGWYSGLGMFSD